ncbi:unnamed protein product [Durusdinium trenchii]|uniref:Uncharacterized protein n=1 Tax=Durusdinium trenchii TaxID=1381693 RepID=A0ABP0MKM1_9DINO
MPTHAEVIAQNPLEAPADFWTNVYYDGSQGGQWSFGISGSICLAGKLCSVLLAVHCARGAVGREKAECLALWKGRLMHLEGSPIYERSDNEADQTVLKLEHI